MKKLKKGDRVRFRDSNSDILYIVHSTKDKVVHLKIINKYVGWV